MLPGVRRSHKERSEFAVWVCENPQCPAQKTRRLEFFGKARRARTRRARRNRRRQTCRARSREGAPGRLRATWTAFSAQSRHRLGTACLRRKERAETVGRIERARQLPLARWLHALAIPRSAKTAHDLARFQNRSTMWPAHSSSKMSSPSIVCAPKSRKPIREPPRIAKRMSSNAGDSLKIIRSFIRRRGRSAAGSSRRLRRKGEEEGSWRVGRCRQARAVSARAVLDWFSAIAEGSLAKAWMLAAFAPRAARLRVAKTLSPARRSSLPALSRR